MKAISFLLLLSFIGTSIHAEELCLSKVSSVTLECEQINDTLYACEEKKTYTPVNKSCKDSGGNKLAVLSPATLIMIEVAAGLATDLIAEYIKVNYIQRKPIDPMVVSVNVNMMKAH